MMQRLKPRLFRPRPSLRTLLIVPFVLQIFGTVGLVGYLSFRNGQKAINDLAGQLMIGVNDRVDQHLNSYLQTAERLSQTNKDAIERGLVGSQDLEKMGRFFWKQAQVYPVGYVLYGSAAGEFAGSGYSTKNEAVIDELDPKRYGDRNNRTYHTNAQGDRTSIEEINKDYAFQKEGWYTDTEKAGKPVWSQIYQWEVDPYPLSIAATQPIFDRDRKLIAVTAVEQRLSQVSDFLHQLKINPAAQNSAAKVFILERDGSLVASSNKQEPPYRLENGKPTRLKAADSRDPKIRETTLALLKQFQAWEQIQTRQQTTFLIQNRSQFALVSPWRDKLGLDWLVVVVIPEAEFMEQINTNLRNTVLLCGLALILATIVGVLTARRISRPILQLSTASQDIAAGNLDRLVQEQRVKEIGLLARSFNNMAQQLHQSFTALETANAELEDRVEARTLELKEANQEIRQLNDRLQEDNLRMSAELDVARHLQQMILPKAAELAQIPDLDIAGFMEPAAEVGGDYYDVIQRDGRVTIGIGDVTGHGLESGVMMIMAQTAVRALVATNQHHSIDLNALNEALYQNAQRMSPGKNLTLALLDYKDGQIRITGQHEEVLMVRSDGTVERIDTVNLGFPIGMIDDIDAFVAQAHIVLHPGDVVVLYTDGITEAENDRRQLYGLDRLIEVIRQHRASSANEIRSAVVEDVRSHIGTHVVYDDITLVVLKKK